MRGSPPGPRSSDAPAPSRRSPCSPCSPPGTSVPPVTSTAIARSGRSANAVVRAPMKSPTSSWTVAAGDVAARVAGRGDPARDLQRDVRPEAVVERARHQPAVEEGNRGRGQHGGIAEAHGRERVVAVVSPDVEMEVSHLDRLLLLAPPHVPFRLDDALNPASAREDLDGCPTSTSAVQPPRPRKKR